MALSGSGEPAKQDQCRKAFEGNEYNPKLADLLEQKHSNCACETGSVGNGSPGPVADDEPLHRIITSPRDVDKEGFVSIAPFEKVFSNGLSVVRSCASNNDLEKLVSDGLWTKPDQPTSSVKLVMTASTEEIRAANSNGDRLFCVYDQTVPRRFVPDEQVPTHVGIFLRHPPAKTEGRKKFQKDFARDLRDIFLKGVRNPSELFEGLLTAVNERAAAGEFQLDEDGKPKVA